MVTVSADQERSKDEAAMWCDLFLGRVEEQSARFGVTRRAELYMRVAGLPLDRVLDALEIDGPGWADRLADLRAQEERDRAAHHQPVSVESGGC
jgi:hypothetical protein